MCFYLCRDPAGRITATEEEISTRCNKKRLQVESAALKTDGLKADLRRTVNAGTVFKLYKNKQKDNKRGDR